MPPPLALPEVPLPRAAASAASRELRTLTGRTSLLAPGDPGVRRALAARLEPQRNARSAALGGAGPEGARP